MSSTFSGRLCPRVSGRAKESSPPMREEPPRMSMGSCCWMSGRYSAMYGAAIPPILATLEHQPIAVCLQGDQDIRTLHDNSIADLTTVG